MLVIGTSNRHRFKSIKRLVEEIDDGITCIQKSIPVDESGNSSIENAKIKALTYANAFKGSNILCIDDEIHLDDPRYTPGEVINRDKEGNSLSKKKIVEYWREILKDRKLMGYINKAFVFINKEGQEYSEVLRINISLHSGDNRSDNLLTNPLNNFIVPEGFNKVITDFNSGELSRFRKPQLKVLEKILINYKS